MTQYKLTEQEARVLAMKFADAVAGKPSYFSGNVKDWLASYMEQYNKAMNEIAQYNQSVGE